ncbi:hypothetical protein [Paenibacillus polymyxa]|uniref:hypothetical protein n=1 Tax=Paenibacillus polymyxa TaxID=1406 RepID=UPI0025B6AE40|nr:hypothetical protein [Paenibacillus polymyxa]MDN4090894.1 hypothetical protein [Paenibacillus polymyxa]
MKTKWLSSMLMSMLLFLMPTMAFAESSGGSGENPFRKLAEKLKFNFAVMDGLDWVFWIVMIVVSLGVIALLVWIVWDIIKFLINVRRAKADFKNTKFWIEAGATILILYLLVGGAFFNIMANMYDWTQKQKIGEQTSFNYQIEPHTYSQFDRSSLL